MLHTGWNSTATTIVGVVSSPGVATNQLNYPSAVTIDSSRAIYVVDRANNRVQKWSVGAFTGVTVAGSASGTAGSTNSFLSTPRDVDPDSNGNLYIADAANHRVVLWNVSATSCTVVAGTGTKPLSGVIDTFFAIGKIIFQAPLVRQPMNSITRTA